MFTDLKVVMVNDPNESLQAQASVTFAGAIRLHRIRVVKGGRGLFVAMPSHRMNASDPKIRLPYYQLLDPKAKVALDRLVLDEYNRLKNV